MQEGSEELGAGHEDTVGQQEVTEERLCWAGLGLGRDFSTSMCAAGIYIPLSQHKQGKQSPAPVAVLSTQAKSTSCQLPVRTNLEPAEIRLK